MYTRQELKKRWKENSKYPTDLGKFRKWLKEDFNVEWTSERGYMYTPKQNLDCTGPCKVPAVPSVVDVI